VQCITLVQDRGQWRSLVNKALEGPVQLDAKNFSISCKVACILAQTPSCDHPEHEAPVQPSHGDLREHYSLCCRPTRRAEEILNTTSTKCDVKQATGSNSRNGKRNMSM